MTISMKNEIITSFLDEIIPNPHSELKYSEDYELLLAVMLSAQTTDKRVNEVTCILFKKYNSLEKLAAAPIDDIMKIIKPIGTFRKKASNIIEISKALLPLGYVPNDREFLENLHGVGRKTTNVVLGIIYGEKCIAVDTHVSRISKRLGLASKNDDVLTIEKKLTKRFKDYDLLRIHHQFILFGRYTCKAINPNCNGCKLKEICREKKK